MSSTTRRILHVDMDAFYASVEQRDVPALRGQPVGVGGRRRGVVMAASYEARAYGVRSAMPTREALARCPQLVMVKPRFEAYREASTAIHEIFRRHTDLVQSVSLDEAYLDVSKPHHGPVSGTLVAQAIRAAIVRETGLTASAGVSYNKFLAKLASGREKPDGLTVVRPGEALRFLAPLPIEAFHGVGPARARRFRAAGVRTGADLQALSEAEAVGLLGKAGGQMWRFAQGIDDRPVRSERTRKSVGVQRTFERDLRGERPLVARLDRIADELGRRVERHGLAGRTLTLRLKTHRFVVSTRQTTLANPVWDADAFRTIGYQLLCSPEVPREPVRLLGLTLGNLMPIEAVGGRQLPLPFPGPRPFVVTP